MVRSHAAAGCAVIAVIRSALLLMLPHPPRPSRCAGGSSQAGRPGASRLPLKSGGERGLVREVRI